MISDCCFSTLTKNASPSEVSEATNPFSLPHPPATMTSVTQRNKEPLNKYPAFRIKAQLCRHPTATPKSGMQHPGACKPRSMRLVRQLLRCPPRQWPPPRHRTLQATQIYSVLVQRFPSLLPPNLYKNARRIIWHEPSHVSSSETTSSSAASIWKTISAISSSASDSNSISFSALKRNTAHDPSFHNTLQQPTLLSPGCRSAKMVLKQPHRPRRIPQSMNLLNSPPANY
ncbi:MAG: hypothetical protein M2R45_04878 [Verrucomicrobia subdivision 3 bacterium]|nr:hypothetical protein [Limisphaerales bacterium]MCS1414372.1 hypothetical protein [Limisphaerales bacterium]